MAVQIGPAVIGVVLGLVVMLGIAWFVNAGRRRRGGGADNASVGTPSSGTNSRRGGDEKVTPILPSPGTPTSSSPVGNTGAASKSPLNEDAFKLKERRKAELKQKSLERYVKLHPEYAS